MTWDDFMPFVLPYAPGCPDSTAEHHLRQAAIEFCKFTNVWQSTLAPNTADGVASEFGLNLPDDSAVNKLLNVTLTRVGFAAIYPTVVTTANGERLITEGSLVPIAFMTELDGLAVWPAPASTSSVAPKVSLRPSQLSATFPAHLSERFAPAISGGALSTILAMDKQEWTDKTSAGIKAAEFNSRKASAASAVLRSFAASVRRPTTRYF